MTRSPSGSGSGSSTPVVVTLGASRDPPRAKSAFDVRASRRVPPEEPATSPSQRAQRAVPKAHPRREGGDTPAPHSGRTCMTDVPPGGQQPLLTFFRFSRKLFCFRLDSFSKMADTSVSNHSARLPPVRFRSEVSMSTPSLTTIETTQLRQLIPTLLGEERGSLVRFLVHLAEFDRRRGWEALGFATLWDYCARELRLQKGCIFRRTHTVALLQRFPRIEGRLLSGSLSMTTLLMLESIISVENSEEILTLAEWKSKDEVEDLVAARMTPKAAPAGRRLLRVHLSGWLAVWISLADRARPHPRVRARRTDVRREPSRRVSRAQRGKCGEDVWRKTHGAIPETAGAAAADVVPLEELRR